MKQPGLKFLLFVSLTGMLPVLLSCREQPPEDHTELIRAGLAEILAHQESACGKVTAWKIDQRFDYLVTCENGVLFRIHVGTEGHVNVNEHRDPDTDAN